MARTTRSTSKRTAAGRTAPRQARRARAGSAGRVERALAGLGLALPAAPSSLANYVGAVVAGKLVFVSGHGPVQDGQLAAPVSQDQRRLEVQRIADRLFDFQ